MGRRAGLNPAMLLTSTRAIPSAPVDIFSDYDVILVVKDIRPFFEDRSWLADFGEVLVVYCDPIYSDPGHGIEMFANVIQYADGLKIDFTLWPVELLQKIVQAPALTAELDAGVSHPHGQRKPHGWDEATDLHCLYSSTTHK